MTDPGRAPLPGAPSALEERLRDLGTALALPATPPLAELIGARLGADARSAPHPVTASRWPWSAPRLRLGLVLAVLAVLLAATAVAAVRFGLGGIRLTFVEATAQPARATVAADLRLGRSVTLDVAAEEVSFELLRPTLSELGEPEHVYVSDLPAGGQVAFVYGPRAGFPVDERWGTGPIFIQFRSDIDPASYEKLITTGVVVQPVSVNGGPGYWIDGGEHTLALVDAEGNRIDAVTRVVRDALIWEQGGLTLRVEAAGTLEGAMRVAESVR